LTREQRRQMAKRLGADVTPARKRGPSLDTYRARAWALKLKGKGR
jgi:hypothetical protein